SSTDHFLTLKIAPAAPSASGDGPKVPARRAWLASGAWPHAALGIRARRLGENAAHLGRRVTLRVRHALPLDPAAAVVARPFEIEHAQRIGLDLVPCRGGSWRASLVAHERFPVRPCI